MPRAPLCYVSSDLWTQDIITLKSRRLVYDCHVISIRLLVDCFYCATSMLNVFYSTLFCRLCGHRVRDAIWDYLSQRCSFAVMAAQHQSAFAFKALCSRSKHTQCWVQCASFIPSPVFTGASFSMHAEVQLNTSRQPSSAVWWYHQIYLYLPGEQTGEDMC